MKLENHCDDSTGKRLKREATRVKQRQPGGPADKNPQELMTKLEKRVIGVEISVCVLLEHNDCISQCSGQTCLELRQDFLCIPICTDAESKLSEHTSSFHHSLALHSHKMLPLV